MVRTRGSQRGFSLATTLVIVALVGGIASALIILSTNQMGVDQKTRDKVRATYLAEAAVEQLAFLLRQAHANCENMLEPGSTHLVDGILLTCVDRKPKIPVDKRTSVLSENPGTDNEADTVTAETTIDDHRIALTAERFMVRLPPFPGDDDYDPKSLSRLTTTMMYSLTAELRYIARAETSDEKLVNVDDTLRRVHRSSLGRVTRVMEFEITPILDKFAFWNGALEMLPGPKAIFNGRVHTNGDLHIGAGTGLDINTDYIRAKGEVYRHRLDNPGGSAWATVTIRDPYADPYNAQGQLGENPWVWDPGYESESTYNSKWELDPNWLEQVNKAPELAETKKIRNIDNESELKLQLTPPEIGTKGVDGYYHKEADIVIQDSTVLQKTGVDGDGNPVYKDITSTLPPKTITESNVYDAREVDNGSGKDGADVKVTVIDMSLLTKGGAFPENGVIYAYRTKTKKAEGATPRYIEGIQLKNGQTLAGDLTVVTNGPAYVQGNYNMDIDPANLPAHADKGQAAGFTEPQPRKGAAIIADAVNLLSEGWNGSKSASSPKAPTAKETTFNFALVTGNVETEAGKSYSGGLENLPRFHENWGGVNCNYRGALMCLWPSEIATGKWGKNNVYTPPNRNWDYDPNFGDPAAAKPPLFPQTVNISRTTYLEGYPAKEAP